VDPHAIYRVGFFPFWEEETDDIEYMFTKLTSHIDGDLLERLEYHASELSRQLVPDEEMAYGPSPTDIFIPSSASNLDVSVEPPKGKPGYKLEQESWSEFEIQKKFVCKRTKIPKQPSEVRDAIMPTPESRYTHRVLSWYLKRGCKRLRCCEWQHSVDDTIMQVESELAHHPWTYQRDFTKSGLMIPHVVLDKFFAGWFARRPDLYIAASDFYTTVAMWDDSTSTWREPVRGHCLGFFTEGTTLLQMILHLLAKELAEVEDTRVHLFNDDHLSLFLSEHDVLKYAAADHQICAALSLMIKEKKTFIAFNSAQYLEEYWIRGVHIPKASPPWEVEHTFAVNIRHAKEYVAAISCQYKVDPALLSVAVDFWGEEFFPNEVQVPYEFGGWISSTVHDFQVSSSLASHDIWKAFQAIGRKESITLKGISPGDNTLCRCLGLTNIRVLEFGEVMNRAFASGDNAAKMYGRFNSSYDIVKHYRKKQKLVLKWFQSASDTPREADLRLMEEVGYDDFYKETLFSYDVDFSRVLEIDHDLPYSQPQDWEWEYLLKNSLADRHSTKFFCTPDAIPEDLEECYRNGIGTLPETVHVSMEGPTSKYSLGGLSSIRATDRSEFYLMRKLSLFPIRLLAVAIALKDAAVGRFAHTHALIQYFSERLEAPVLNLQLPGLLCLASHPLRFTPWSIRLDELSPWRPSQPSTGIGTLIGMPSSITDVVHYYAVHTYAVADSDSDVGDHSWQRGKHNRNTKLSRRST
jgi:hypothetical protein